MHSSGTAADQPLTIFFEGHGFTLVQGDRGGAGICMSKLCPEQLESA